MAKKGIIKSAAILTASGIINRILGFVYRIYMSNIIGAEGMGLYQLIMPVYSLAWSISCSGFTTTVSKLTAFEKAKGRSGNARRILNIALFITTALGVFLGILLFFGAEFICEAFFSDDRLVLAMKILSLSFPFMAAGSCIRGYFFGLQEAFVPAVSQVVEQLARMAVIYLLAGTFITKGIEYACAAAVLGILAGEFLSFLMIWASFGGKRDNKKPILTRKEALSMIAAMALPLTLNRVSGSLLATAENILLPKSLVLYGMSKSTAIGELGKISGMAMPLIYFPSAILVSLSISLVPAISEALSAENFKRINYTVSKVILFSCVVGAGASVIFAVFAESLGQAIYNESIGQILMYLGIMCPFLYMNTTLNGILNGLGEQVFIFRNSIISSGISIGFTLFLAPRLGIEGYILGSFVSVIFLCLLSLNRIRSLSNIKIDYANWFFKPFICALACGLFVNLQKTRLLSLGERAGVAAGVVLLGGLYIIFIILLGCVSENDIRILLGGRAKAKPVKLAKKAKAGKFLLS